MLSLLERAARLKQSYGRGGLLSGLSPHHDFQPTTKTGDPAWLIYQDDGAVTFHRSGQAFDPRKLRRILCLI
jgi:hypothetical protein